MPTIKLEKSSNKTPQEAFNQIKNFLASDKELQKLDPKLEYNFDDSGLKGNAKGSYFEAKMSVAPHADGSQVSFVVDLPFHLALMKGMIEKTLGGKIEKALS